MERMNIFLIDDDFIYHSITEMLLERASRFHDFQSFNNGSDALEHIKTNTFSPENLPDIILLDINMPIMNGWDFLEQFARVAPQLAKEPQICMMTSSSLDRDKERALQYPYVSEFITKPITINQLERLTNNFESTG